MGVNSRISQLKSFKSRVQNLGSFYNHLEQI